MSKRPTPEALAKRGFKYNEHGQIVPIDMKVHPLVQKAEEAAINKPKLINEISMLNILAIDQASKCGWATKNGHGTWNLTTMKDESSGMKMLRFRAKLKEICELEQINLIAYERVSGQHKSSIIHAAKMVSVIEVFCEENGIAYRAYSATEVKKFATGKGNAGKPLMVAAAASKYGYTGGDDNVADALHIYHLSVSDLG